ncbi:hypothetical protein POM88_014322 [Heracleum sosnowskyi]|uniref:DUF8040 domain-containing protein n=1 Tax=Heracleum sosnowskyi TaxID=360622 RepID=A0AAD8N450_9APIA|nr:hypothetical protein POM88_014322 [Heracleum sosnowskyi]
MLLTSVQENSKYAKLRDKDLSLHIQYYDTLFGDIVATGQRARAANTYSAVNLEAGEEFTEVMGEEDEGKEGNGDSDDNNIQSLPNLFPAPSLKSSKGSGSKRKKSGAEFVRAGLDSLAIAMSYRRTQSTVATDDVALNVAVDILDNMEQVPLVASCTSMPRVERYGLVPTRGMSKYEEVGMFLMTVAHGTGNRLMQEMFNHSGETISRHFHSVLEAICSMSQYYPHFKNAIGAIDGIHIKY